MNIVNWIGTNALNFGVVLGATIFSIWIGKKVITIGAGILQRMIQNAIENIKDPEDRVLAKDIVHTIERKFPDVIGYVKKEKAIVIMKKLMPALSEKAASDLIDWSVLEMNRVLKEV